MVPPLPSGMDMLGWIMWALFIILLGAGILLVLKLVLPDVLQQRTSDSATISDEVMRELLREIKMLRREIEELRKELQE